MKLLGYARTDLEYIREAVVLRAFYLNAKREI